MINKENKLYVIVFFLFAFALLMTIVSAKIITVFPNLMKNDQAAGNSNTAIAWEQIYPFDTVVEVTDSGVVHEGTSSVDKFSEKIKKFSTLGNKWIGGLPYYGAISKVGYVINSFISDPSLGSTYVKTKNGYWVYVESSRIQKDTAKEELVPFISLQNYVESKGKDFIYFYAPSKVCAVDSQLLDGVVSYENESIDTYLRVMDEYGLRHVDFRKKIHDAGKDHYSLFYITDPHWNVESGLWAASELSKELNDQFGYSMENPYDLGNYKLVTFPNAEFGAYGEGVTRVVADPEDFTIPYPEFETNYRIEVPHKEIDVTGSFADVFVNQEDLDKLVANGGGPAYAKMTYGNPPYAKITNYNNPDGPKVLVIRDSFFSVVAPYFASSCSELVLIDTRPENGNFSGSIVNVIDTFDPDIVVSFLGYPQAIRLNK